MIRAGISTLCVVSIGLVLWLGGNTAHAQLVDSFNAPSAVVDEKGWLKDSYSTDGLHPNAGGYKAMTEVLSASLRKALP